MKKIKDMEEMQEMKEMEEMQEMKNEGNEGNAALQILNDTWQNMPEYANHLKKIVFYSVTMRDTF